MEAILKGSLAGPTGMWWQTELGSTEVAPKVLLVKGGGTWVNHAIHTRYPKRTHNRCTQTDMLHVPYAGRNGTRAPGGALPVPSPGSQFGNGLAASPCSQRSETQTAPSQDLHSPELKDAYRVLGCTRPGPFGPT